MKLFIEKKWLLVTVAATLLLSGCSSVKQSIQDTIDTSVETLNTKKQNSNLYQLSLSVTLMAIPQY